MYFHLDEENDGVPDGTVCADNTTTCEGRKSKVWIEADLKKGIEEEEEDHL